MAFSTFWWLLAALAIISELLTGTVYLLLIGAGFVAAALASYAGLSVTAQTVVAAAVGAVLVLLWWRIRAPQRRAALAAQASPDLNLDIGQTVHVEAWSAEGTASVMHRGARWTVVAEDGAAAPHAPGSWRIVAVVGSSFVVSPAAAG
ncbi:NfeD family protein [Xylophilus rhododendri]|uniref:NfeD family protein n=1 Tax=Xylophilus rhododendri TaxID=2697032 RepID=A0A857IZD4_9BURK|nr:NfeD family protein [Xylophilus rhododendri]QHI96826.1 NfeD family protein [Xylophilus rhododendri]